MRIVTGSDALRSAMRLICLVWVGCFLLSAGVRAGEPAASAATAAVGEVTFVQGVATAQRPGVMTPRFLERGESLFEGEVVSTGATGYTIVSFKDGTKFTLRPNTSFTIERYQQGGANDSAVFKLLKGGMRAVTGLISKRGPDAMQVNTATATIGIRGTSFDARVCGAECAAEQTRDPRAKPAAVVDQQIVARVVLVTGSAQAIATGGAARALSEGSALFNGDSVRTGAASHAVLAFRDQTKVTVIANSEYKLEDVRFTGANSDSGNFATRIVRGGVRTLTGLLGKSNPKAVNTGIATAVIGLRGSGYDAYLAPLCPPGGTCAETAFLNMWQDAAELRVGDQIQVVGPGETGVFTPSTNTLTQLLQTPAFIDPNAPRPDTITVNFEVLFAVVPLGPGSGLHVGMRGEGRVVLQAAGGFVYLEGLEGGFLPEGEQLPVRTETNWATVMLGTLPLPTIFDGRPTGVQLPRSGGVICEIR